MPLTSLAAYRPVAVALVASAALHGVVLVGYRAGLAGEGEPDLAPVAYSATLEMAAPAVQATLDPARPPAAKPRARARPKKNEIRPEETVAMLPALEEASAATLPEEPPGSEPAPSAESPLSAEAPLATETAPPQPEIVALARPSAPPVPEPLFRADALPARLRITYALTSPLVEGQAEYTWKRKGERYEISGSAEASGFFTLFLEGRITQESSGTVTPEGLRPERFSERRGDTPEEGLAFDWDSRTVEFRRGSTNRKGVLTDSTVDWLSMIFQLAHMPPAQDGTLIRVYTQRRMHEYRLMVVGQEELDLPFGRATTLHLRHEGAKPEEAVDVWLGVDQHYLPVKLRYPVARGRLMVEQTATSIKSSAR
jgi:hypothetical protein